MNGLPAEQLPGRPFLFALKRKRLLEAALRSQLVMVGAEGFEPPALCSQSRCATRLRYAPTPSSLAQADMDLASLCTVDHEAPYRQPGTCKPRSNDPLTHSSSRNGSIAIVISKRTNMPMNSQSRHVSRRPTVRLSSSSA